MSIIDAMFISTFGSFTETRFFMLSVILFGASTTENLPIKFSLNTEMSKTNRVNLFPQNIVRNDRRNRYRQADFGRKERCRNTFGKFLRRRRHAARAIAWNDAIMPTTV